MQQFIKNRHGLKVAILINHAKNQRGLAFIMHGLGGFKESPDIQTMADSFLAHHITTVRFDTTNTFGASEGNYENATFSQYYHDLEDVISWAKKQHWYQEPYILAGHSLGAMAVTLYAELHHTQVKALAPISTVVSGKLSKTNYQKKDLAEWERSGWKISPSTSKPGTVKKLRWHPFANDLITYDLLKLANKLTMPVLLIVGENDTSTPVANQKILFEHLPAKKELRLIKGAQHTFREKTHLAQLKKIFDNWIEENCA